MHRQQVAVAVAGTLVAGALAVAIAGPALAWSHPGQTKKDAERGTAEQGLTGPILQLLGMTEAQVLEERQRGHSFADIAAARGVDETTLLATATVAAKRWLDPRVAAGRISPEEAELRLRLLPEHITRHEPPEAHRVSP
jgi:hypothetical protein